MNTQNSHHLVPENISKAKPTHATIDNSDDMQQTLICLATTQRTNATVYIPKIQPLTNVTNCLENEVINAPFITRNTIDYKEYKIRKLAEPTLAKEFKSVHPILIEELLEIDSRMSVAATIISIPFLVHEQPLT